MKSLLIAAVMLVSNDQSSVTDRDQNVAYCLGSFQFEQYMLQQLTPSELGTDYESAVEITKNNIKKSETYLISRGYTTPEKIQLLKPTMDRVTNDISKTNVIGSSQILECKDKNISKDECIQKLNSNPEYVALIKKFSDCREEIDKQ